MINIGIMQGRLSFSSNGRIQSFPKTTWREEFYKAIKAGLTNIEWIFEADEWEKNPIASEYGIKEINDIIRETGITIESVCADYFMDVPYLTGDENLRKELRDKLKWLVSQSKKIGAKNIDIPFVDASKIHNRYQFNIVKEFIEPSIKFAEKIDIIIALETSLNPHEFLELLLIFDHPNLKANYDTGNSSGIGYDCVQELSYYGNFIQTLHIKDRLINNGTKPLGTGSANFESFFLMFSKLNYKGPIILQAAREEEGKEIETAIKNRIFVEKYWKKYKNK